MRRADRQVSIEAIPDIIDACRVARIAMVDEGKPYMVPMNFGYSMRDGVLTMYFHCAREGRKIDVLRKNPQVFFEMDCDHELLVGKAACSFSFAYASIMGEGEVQFVEDPQEKYAAIEAIMLHQTGRAGFSIPEEAVKGVEILKLTSTSFTGKRSARPS